MLFWPMMSVILWADYTKAESETEELEGYPLEIGASRPRHTIDN